MKRRFFFVFIAFLLLFMVSMTAIVSAAPLTLVVRAGAANDGYVAAWSGPTYTPLRNHAGQAAVSSTYANYAGLHAITTSNQYDELYRAVILFNTSALPDDCTITAVKFGIKGTSKSNGLGSFSYGITGFNPSKTDGTFVMGDYQRFYNDRWADSDIPYANLLTTSWNNWTGNSRFISNISKTGWTGVMVRDKPDIDNNSALITWKSGATSRFVFQDTGYGAAPFLEITYTTSSGSPVASFTSNVTTGSAPLPVQFTDQSTGTAPLGYAWDFDNNGVIDSTSKNPVFTFSNTGTYTVNLTVTNGAGSSSVTKTITVTAPVLPAAAFITNVTSGNAPLAVKFTDQSTGTGPLGYAWDFDNNGVIDSTAQNPAYVYSNAGTYTANLTVTNGAGSNSVTKTITVNSAPVLPTAAFSTNVTGGTAPLAVKFTDQSTGTAPLGYAWDFDNNGVIDSTDQNPVAVYSYEGTYTANLTVSNSAGSNSVTKTITVTAAPIIPTAIFNTNVTGGTAPLAVKFTDQSTGTAPLGYAWDFDNNGVIDSTAQNPAYVYSNAGTYAANLTVSNGAGSNSVTKTITVTSAPVALKTLLVRAGAANDGYVAAWSGPTYTPLRNHAGQAVSTSTYANYAGLHAITTSNQYDELYRAVILFNTSALPDDCTITAVKFGVMGSSVSNGLGSFSYGITGFSPTKTDGTFVMGDYQRFYNDRWSDSDIPYTNLLTSNWNNWTGNSRFISNISKTGWTGVMVRDKPDIDNNSALITWNSGATSRFVFQDAGYGAAPFLEITYSTSGGSPVAAFTSTVTNGVAPLPVQFTDQSTGTGPLSYAWDFDNNGVIDSTVQNPGYVYSNPGTYTANLTVTNGAGSSSVTKTITVTSAPVSPTAVFTTNVTSGNAPLAVKFTDQSTGTGPLGYAWDFDNNGVIDSTVQNPVYVYSNPGTYTANLTVTNSAGSSSVTKTITVTSPAPVMPVAGFSANVTIGSPPLGVQFTDQSTGTAPLSYAWDFDNNGVIDSTLKNPVFTYLNSGTYTVNLTVTNSAGTNSSIKTNYIAISPQTTSNAGIALTFDDNTVDQWYAIRSIFQKYNAHVTFFVSNFNLLTQDQINELKTLQADGHEIAFHGLYHTDVVTYLQTHTVQQYLDYEIIPGINLMKSNGFNPVDFAFPYGSDDPRATEAMKPYFLHMRDTYYDWDDTIYYQYGSNVSYIAGIGIDDNTYGNSMTDIYNGIDKAKSDKKILIFYCHEPVPSNPGDYQTSYTRIENILKYVSDNNLKTYTVAEIH